MSTEIDETKPKTLEGVLELDEPKPKNTRKRTFDDAMENMIDPNLDRKTQVRKLCFQEAAQYWDTILSGETTIAPWELPHEIINNFNDEAKLFEKTLRKDLAEIIKLGTDAKKKQVEAAVGAFDLRFTPYEYIDEDEDADEE
jgi:hypothetical protein